MKHPLLTASYCAIVMAITTMVLHLTPMGRIVSPTRWQTLGHTLHIGANYADTEWRVRYLRCASIPPECP